MFNQFHNSKSDEELPNGVRDSIKENQNLLTVPVEKSGGDIPIKRKDSRTLVFEKRIHIFIEKQYVDIAKDFVSSLLELRFHRLKGSTHSEMVLVIKSS